MVASHDTRAGSLKVLSTLAVKGAMPALEAGFIAAGGPPLEITFAPTNALLQAIGAGARGDVAIVTRPGAMSLAERGIIGAGYDIGVSYVGLAVKDGAARPDISSPEALVATLQAASSIAYSKLGASGVYFAALIDRLGIGDAVRAKARIVSGGFTGEEVAAGRAEVAIQQVSELKVVPGITVVGPLPKALQDPVVFTVAPFAEPLNASAADAFCRYLAGKSAAPLLVASGLDLLD